MLQGSIIHITSTFWPLKSRHGESTQSPTGTEEIAIKTKVHLFIYLFILFVAFFVASCEEEVEQEEKTAKAAMLWYHSVAAVIRCGLDY